VYHKYGVTPHWVVAAQEYEKAVEAIQLAQQQYHDQQRKDMPSRNNGGAHVVPKPPSTGNASNREVIEIILKQSNPFAKWDQLYLSCYWLDRSRCAC